MRDYPKLVPETLSRPPITLNPPSNKENHRAPREFLRDLQKLREEIQIQIFPQKSAQSIETNLMFRFLIDAFLCALCGLVVVLGYADEHRSTSID
jgi:hypothetical protein